MDATGSCLFSPVMQLVGSKSSKMTPILFKIMQNTLKIREIRGRASSTSVECIRQIGLFLQNKAKFTKCPNGLNASYNKGL